MADILAAATVLLIVLCIVAVPVIGLGIVLGYGLKALIPGLDLGWAVVAGAVFATGIVDMTARLLLAMHAEGRSADEGDVMIDEPWITIPRSFFLPAAPRKGRKKKR